MRHFLRFFTLLLAMILVGCGASIPTIKPYKMDIQQGNVVTSEMLLKLRPGMTKSQVQFIMGTPLLVDSFHSNRWDYFYQLRKQGEVVTQRRVILDFESDLLKRVRGDVVPKGMTAEDIAKKLETEASKEGKPEVPAKETDHAAEPIVNPIEAPDVESAESMPASVEAKPAPVEAPEATEGNAPASVLAVPIPVEPAAPSDLAPKAEPSTEVPAPTKVPSNDVIKDEVPVDPAEVSKSAPKERIEELKSVAQDPAVESDSVALPSKHDAVESSTPLAPKNRLSEKLPVFRLDHQLDTSRVNQDSAPAETPPQASVVQEVKESQDDASPDESDPGFFERMLEKIGF